MDFKYTRLLLNEEPFLAPETRRNKYHAKGRGSIRKKGAFSPDIFRIIDIEDAGVL